MFSHRWSPEISTPVTDFLSPPLPVPPHTTAVTWPTAWHLEKHSMTTAVTNNSGSGNPTTLREVNLWPTTNVFVHCNCANVPMCKCTNVQMCQCANVQGGLFLPVSSMSCVHHYSVPNTVAVNPTKEQNVYHHWWSTSEHCTVCILYSVQYSIPPAVM